MADSKYFGIPFATSGDKTAIPEATQPSGAISFTQGFGPDYERDPSTDPLAKRVPRDETNELYFQVTNALKFLQLYGTPEWYATDDAGNPVSYPLSARVRYDAGAGMQAWRSIVASNTAIPGSDATKWTLDNPFDIATLEATLAEALAGTLGTKLVTPRRLASASQRGAWNYAAATGTANALTANLSPAPSALSVGMEINIKISTANTGAATLNLNGLGAVSIRKADLSNSEKGDLVAGSIVTFVYDGAFWLIAGSYLKDIPARRSFVYGAGSHSFIAPDGVYWAFVEMWGGGGGGGGHTGAACGAGGGGGGYSRGWVPVVPGTSYPITVGSGGSGGLGATNGQAGGTSSFGSAMSATGGGGGGYSTSGPSLAFGGFGVGVGGQLTLGGISGGYGIVTGGAYWGGIGGGAFGTSTQSQTIQVAGFNGNYPAGGGNGGSGAGGSSFGGNGSDGVVIVSY